MSGPDSRRLRRARREDVAVLDDLIRRSARGLSRGYYSDAEIEAAIRHVFGVDTSLIDDGTYFVVEDGGQVVGCGGWSRRATLYGGDQRPVGARTLLDPRVDAARIRAFFVDPGWARRGVGSLLLRACTDAARAAGFRALELMSTLPGVPLYRRHGFEEGENVRDRLPDGTEIRFVRMRRRIESGREDPPAAAGPEGAFH